MEEIYACIKECDPEAVMLGEGASLDGPVNILSVNTNPKRAIDGLGPRDFLLQLGRYGAKRFVIDQGPGLAPASGYCTHACRPDQESLARYLTKLMRDHGGRDVFTHLLGDLSIRDDLLIVPWAAEAGEEQSFRLPDPWAATATLANELDKAVFRRDADDAFVKVPPGVYRMWRT
jgi:hypothetical protein